MKPQMPQMKTQMAQMSRNNISVNPCHLCISAASAVKKSLVLPGQKKPPLAGRLSS
jgi:hypothetical protein